MSSFFLLLCVRSLRAQWFDQTWPGVNVYWKLNDNSRLFILYAGTRVQAGGYSDGKLGAHVDLFLRPLVKQRMERHPDIATNRFLSIRLGYLYGATPKNRLDPFVEHTPTVEITPRFYLPKRISMTTRSRFDFRFLDGDFTPRFRLREKVERSFGLGRFTLTPYAHAEAFYDWRYNSIHRFRFAGGGEFQLHRHFVLEAYYLRQQDSRPVSTSMNVTGLVAQIYLP